MNALRNKLPMFGREGKKKALIAGLNAVYEQVSIENGVPLGDFPPLALMKVHLLFPMSQTRNPGRTDAPSGLVLLTKNGALYCGLE